MGSVNSCASRQDGERPNAFARRVRERFRRITRRQQIQDCSSSIARIDALVLDTLKILKDFGPDQSDFRSPVSLHQLSEHADDGDGWIQVLMSMVNVVPLEDPLGATLITAVLCDCPLPDKETITKLSQMLDLCNKSSIHKTAKQHRNICVILGMLTIKLPGPASVALLTEDTLNYLYNNMDLEVNPSIIVYSLFALEKFAQLRENRHTIIQFKDSVFINTLLILEKLASSCQPLYIQIGFYAKWLLDNIFVDNQRPSTYSNVSMEGVNVILNHKEAREYLKFGPSGLEARSDSCCFESVRCTFQIDKGTWYYEVTLLTAGIMQIGWSTRNTKFLNHEGFGVGDDEYSVAYDGCRQLLWYGGQSINCLSGRAWQAGDTVGCLLQLEDPVPVAKFYLNGQIVASNEMIFLFAKSEYFAAASFMAFQQCCFNFGNKPFTHPPKSVTFNVMNDHGKLDEKEKAILPKKMILEQLGEMTTDEDSCTICFDLKADVTLEPCKHEGYCKPCAQKLLSCPICRQFINKEEINQQKPATNLNALVSE